MNTPSPSVDDRTASVPAPARATKKRFVAPRLVRHERMPAVTGFSGFFPLP